MQGTTTSALKKYLSCINFPLLLLDVRSRYQGISSYKGSSGGVQFLCMLDVLLTSESSRTRSNPRPTEPGRRATVEYVLLLPLAAAATHAVRTKVGSPARVPSGAGLVVGESRNGLVRGVLLSRLIERCSPSPSCRWQTAGVHALLVKVYQLRCRLAAEGARGHAVGDGRR